MHNIFIKNKYTKWYYMLVESVGQLNRKCLTKKDPNFIYYEKHHIIPKSLGGLNDKSNLVLLTPREHFICHLLLTKMCVDKFHSYKMNHAFNLLLNTSKVIPNASRRYAKLKNTFRHSDDTKAKMSAERKLRSPQSEETKRKRSESLSGRKFSEEHKHNLSKSHSGKILSQEHKEKLSKSGTGRIVSEETKEKISLANKGKSRPYSADIGRQSKGLKRIYREDGTYYYKNP